MPYDPETMTLKYFVYCILHPDTSKVHHGPIWQDTAEG